MPTKFKTKFEYGKPTMAEFSYLKETAKQYAGVKKEREYRFGDKSAFIYLPSVISKDETVFDTEAQAREWLLDVTKKEAIRLRNEADRLEGLVI